MQKVTVQIDWYTKVILTLIAVLLAGLLVKPYIITKPVGADEYSEAKKGEYSIASAGESGRVWVLEKHTGKLSLLTITDPFNELEVIGDGYLDEILKWDSD